MSSLKQHYEKTPLPFIFKAKMIVLKLHTGFVITVNVQKSELPLAIHSSSIKCTCIPPLFFLPLTTSLQLTVLSIELAHLSNRPNGLLYYVFNTTQLQPLSCSWSKASQPLSLPFFLSNTPTESQKSCTIGQEIKD